LGEGHLNGGQHRGVRPRHVTLLPARFVAQCGHQRLSMLFSAADSNCHGWAMTWVKHSVARHFSCPGRDASAREVTGL